MFTSRHLCTLFLLLTFHITAFSQKNDIQQRIFLVGDAGSLSNGGHPVVDWLKKNVDWNDTVNSVIYLGDNIYPEGLPIEGDVGYEESKKVLDYQIGLVKGKKARAYVIPGNHDWMNGQMQGFLRATNQSNYINGLGLPNIKAYPTDGCPGPVFVEVDKKVILVFGDSQWFLHLHNKPGPGSGCAASTIDEFVTELDEIIATHPNHLLIFGVHHPFYTYGDHGGDYSWKDHLFPLLNINKSLYIPMPVLGSIYPVSRGFFGNIQDIYHPLYRNMINEIEKSLKKHPNPIHVAGHEHGLQLNIKDSIPYIVSGSGSRLTGLRKGKYNVFSEVNLGLSMIEVKTNGEVTVYFYDVRSAGLSAPTFTKQLKSIAPAPPTIAEEIALMKLPDTVAVIPNASLRGNPWKRFLIGENYREEWTETMRVQVLDIDKEMGGLVPVKQSGGGTQMVLTLEDKKKKQWLLRTLDRFPQNVIPSDLRAPLNRYIKVEDVSASYPFASIVVGNLSRAAGIAVSRRKIIYIPDDPRLSRFRENFKNKIAILEEKEPLGLTNNLNTADLALKLQKDIKTQVDQEAVLRARIMDNFVLDFNRNQSQWSWYSNDKGDHKKYKPIPLNPSQAFFVKQGVLPWLSQKMLAIPEITGFEAKKNNLNGFNTTAYNFDHRFLNALSEADWDHQVDSFLKNMTDSAIDRAALKYTSDVTKPNARDITSVLKKRREFLKDEMMRYYRFLSKEVTVVGAAGMEQYAIDYLPDGMIKVVVQEMDSIGVLREKLYERVFDPKVTKEIRIYGLEGDDRFLLTGENSPTRIRITGGAGTDNFINESKAANVHIYDVTFDSNQVSGDGFINHIAADPTANLYNRQQFKHDYTSPGLSVAYNVDESALIGGEVEFFKHGFRKEPFKYRQLIGAKFASQTSSWNFRYEADFTQAIGHYDLLIRGDLKAPTNVTNYFGNGTNTKFDHTKGIGHYRTRYDAGNLYAGLRLQSESWMNLNIGPRFDYYKIEQPSREYKKPVNSDLYNAKYFLGAEGSILLNTKNNVVLPTRGADIKIYGRQLFGLNSRYRAITQLGLDISIFMSLTPNTPIVLATRFGFKHNIGRFEYPMANYLSGVDNLRGYRKDRFAGRSVAYSNVELRLRLLQFRTYLFPGSLGILAFNDIGKVWADGEHSQRWHDGFGGGVWLSPVNRFVFTGTVAHSPEEDWIPMVTFGFQF